MPVCMGFWRRIIIAILLDNDIKGITACCMETINKIRYTMQQIGIPADDIQYLASGDDRETETAQQKRCRAFSKRDVSFVVY